MPLRCFAVSWKSNILLWTLFTTCNLYVLLRLCCCLKVKDTNLKAIHNSAGGAATNALAVAWKSKILIWKLFTTHSNGCSPMNGCCLKVKDTNLKAIHNEVVYVSAYAWAVAWKSKILIWKLFTTGATRTPISRWAVAWKSKILIWKLFTTVGFQDYHKVCCCLKVKDTNLKAIHNHH